MHTCLDESLLSVLWVHPAAERGRAINLPLAGIPAPSAGGSQALRSPPTLSLPLLCDSHPVRLTMVLICISLTMSDLGRLFSRLHLFWRNLYLSPLPVF